MAGTEVHEPWQLGYDEADVPLGGGLGEYHSDQRRARVTTLTLPTTVPNEREILSETWYFASRICLRPIIGFF